MGVVVLEVPPPPSRNATSKTRGGKHKQHRRKKRDEADLRTLLLAHNVPCPIPGDRVHATAVALFPVNRNRDEGNFRDSLEKALGDALCPHQSKEERELKLEPLHRFLTEDTDRHFTFGALTFGQTDLIPGTRRRAPAVVRLQLVWGDDAPPLDAAGELPRAASTHELSTAAAHVDSLLAAIAAHRAAVEAAGDIDVRNQRSAANAFKKQRADEALWSELPT